MTLKPIQEKPPAISLGESRTKAWGMTLMLVLLYILNWADKAVLGIVAKPIREELDLSATQFGMIGSAFFIAFTLGNLLAGPLSRWMGLKVLLVVLALSWSIAMLPLVVWVSFVLLLLSRIFLGLMEGPSAAIVHTALYSWHPVEKRGLPSAAIASGAFIASIVIAPLLGIIVAAYGWHSAFLVLGLVGFFWAGAWIFVGKIGPYGADHVKASQGEPSASDNEAPRLPWMKIFLSRTFIGAAFTLFAMYMVISVFLTWLPSYFESGLGFPRVQSAAMVSLPGIFGIVVLFTLSAIGDKLISRGVSSRIVRGVIPAAGALLCGVSLMLPPVLGEITTSPWLPAIVVSVGYALGSTIFPLFTAAMSEFAPAGQLAGTLGVLYAFMGLGGVVGPWLTGVILDAAANEGAGYIQAFQIFGAVAFTAGILALILFNPQRDRRALMAVASTPVSN